MHEYRILHLYICMYLNRLKSIKLIAAWRYCTTYELSEQTFIVSCPDFSG